MKFIKSKLERYLRRIFELGVAVKGLNGLWETTAGLSILIIGKARFAGFFAFLARQELIETPRDPLIRAGTHILQSFPIGAKTFLGLYFLIHGIINIFLAIQLYRNRLWAYLVTITVLIGFIIYQAYRISLYHSLFLTFLTVLDILFIILTWHEYRYQKSLPVEERSF